MKRLERQNAAEIKAQLREEIERHSRIASAWILLKSNLAKFDGKTLNKRIADACQFASGSKYLLTYQADGKWQLRVSIQAGQGYSELFVIRLEGAEVNGRFNLSALIDSDWNKWLSDVSDDLNAMHSTYDEADARIDAYNKAVDTYNAAFDAVGGHLSSYFKTR